MKIVFVVASDRVQKFQRIIFMYFIQRRGAIDLIFSRNILNLLVKLMLRLWEILKCWTWNKTVDKLASEIFALD